MFSKGSIYINYRRGNTDIDRYSNTIDIMDDILNTGCKWSSYKYLNP